MRDKVTVKKVFVKCMSVFAVLLALQLYANKLEYVNTYAAEEEEEEDLDSEITGKVNDTISFKYENGVITFSGTGRLSYYYDEAERPIAWGYLANDGKWTGASKALTKRMNALAAKKRTVRVVINEGITEIGKEAFNHNAYDQSFPISSVSLPNSLTMIDVAAFNTQRQMTSINLHSGIKKIGESAFFECSKLKNVQLYDGVQYGASCFAYSGVESITIPATAELSNNVFAYCDKLTNLTIENGVKIIPQSTFADCVSINEIVIPSSVEEIGDSAFAISGTDPVGGAKKITINEGVKKIGWNAFVGNTNVTNIVIPDSVENMGKDIFGKCTNLRSITLPSNITVISENMFSGCSSLENIVFPENLTFIGDSAFYGCSSLKSIVFPEKLTEFDEYAFMGCTSLKEITLPVGLEQISYMCFYNCDSLTDIYYEGTEKAWEKIKIKDCNNFGSATKHFGDKERGDDKKSSSSSEKDSSSSSDRKDDSSSSDRDNSSSSYYPIDETVPETGSLVEATVRSAVSDESGAPILQSVEATSYVTYNGKKHTLSSLAKTKKLAGDIDVRVYGDVLNYANPAYKFKNNKDVSEKKQPYFTLSFKAIKGVATPAQKKYIKALNKELKNQRVYFEIKPANLNKARVESSKANKRKTKLTTLKISIGSNTFKLGKKDYTLRAVDGGFEVTGKGNFTGTLFVTP